MVFPSVSPPESLQGSRSFARSAKTASYPISVRQVMALLHTSFRPHLTMTPLRFANPSTSIRLGRGLSPPSCYACSAYKKGRAGALPVQLRGVQQCQKSNTSFLFITSPCAVHIHNQHRVNFKNLQKVPFPSHYCRCITSHNNRRFTAIIGVRLKFINCHSPSIREG